MRFLSFATVDSNLVNDFVFLQGFNIKSVVMKGLKVHVWDIGGLLSLHLLPVFFLLSDVICIRLTSSSSTLSTESIVFFT